MYEVQTLNRRNTNLCTYMLLKILLIRHQMNCCFNFNIQQLYCLPINIVLHHWMSQLAAAVYVSFAYIHPHRFAAYFGLRYL